MFIVCKRNIILPSSDGSHAFPVAKGFIGEVPDWAAETDYFKALVADGKIGVPETKRDKDVVTEAEKAPRRRKNEE